MSEARHVAIVPIYPDLLLLTMLGFPCDTKVVRVFIDEDVHGQRMNFVLEHPDLPLTREGAQMMIMTPVFEAGARMVSWDVGRSCASSVPEAPPVPPGRYVRETSIFEPLIRLLRRPSSGWTPRPGDRLAVPPRDPGTSKVPRPRDWPASIERLDVSTVHDIDVRVPPGDSVCEARDREISPDLKGPKG